MMSLTDQWNRADCDAVLHKGGGGNGGNIEEEEVGDIALPPSAAYAVIDLPSKLTSVPQSDTHATRWWDLPAMSVIFCFRSFHSVRLQGPARQALIPETCMDDLKKNQWVMNAHASASHQGLKPMHGFTILRSFWSRESAAVECESILLSSLVGFAP